MRAVFVLCVLLLAGEASAQNYTATPVVNAHRDGNGGRAAASMDVHAPPAAVWEILSDCPNARRYMRELISCRVLERGDGWDVREHRVRGWPLKPVLRSVSRITLEPNRRLTFHRLEGDWSRSDGEWRLTPIDDGRGTHVEYELDAAIPSPFPASWTQSVLIGRMRASLLDLRREAERMGAHAN
jgi:uncharacterized protein YndB with AHSA1/START domain